MRYSALSFMTTVLLIAVVASMATSSLLKFTPVLATHSCDIDVDPGCIIGEGPDSDGDQLSDEYETTVTGTDPNNPDTDGDGLTDLQELILFGGICCRPDPNNPDSDGDGLSDGDEFFIYGTGVTSSDTDNDGLNDYQEVITYGTNPLNADTDSDGLSDSTEIEMGTNPNNPDTDGDGVPDGRDPDPLDMFVVPESPIGSIAMVISSLAALGAFFGLRHRRQNGI